MSLCTQFFRQIIMKNKITVTLFFISISLLFLSLKSETFAASGVTTLGYAIQMGAFAEIRNAERLVGKLQAKGIDAFYYRKDNGIYAVRFGDFPSKSKARETAEKLVSERIIATFYIAPPKEIVFGAAPPEKTAKTGNTKERGGNKYYTNDIQGEREGKISSDMGTIAARTAERFVGIPYRWGGDTVVEGMDCSGFVRAVFNLCGVSIPRTSREQFKTGETIAKAELKDGDLVFFGDSDERINHVGIYVGNGKFVHAPKRGEEIKITGIDESYFEKRFVGARRYFQ